MTLMAPPTPRRRVAPAAFDRWADAQRLDGDYRELARRAWGAAERHLRGSAAENLTPRQLAVCRAYLRLRGELGHWPTMAEAAAALGVTKTTLFAHLQELRRKGAVS